MVNVYHIMTSALRYNDGVTGFYLVFMPVDYAFAVAALKTKKLVTCRMRFHSDIFAGFQCHEHQLYL